MRRRRIQSDYNYTAKLIAVTVLVACVFAMTALLARPTTKVERLWWASLAQGEVLQQDGATGWRPINPGDALPPGSLVKIGPASYLILVRPHGSLSFTRDDRYTVPN